MRFHPPRVDTSHPFPVVPDAVDFRIGVQRLVVEGKLLTLGLTQLSLCMPTVFPHPNMVARVRGGENQRPSLCAYPSTMTKIKIEIERAETLCSIAFPGYRGVNSTWCSSPGSPADIALSTPGLPQRCLPPHAAQQHSKTTNPPLASQGQKQHR